VRQGLRLKPRNLYSKQNIAGKGSLRAAQTPSLIESPLRGAVLHGSAAHAVD
jgi:hypothetical protein